MRSENSFRVLELLNEVGAYALEPVDTPRSLERTYGYYVGWRSCIMYLQGSVRTQNSYTEDEFHALLENARLAGERMLSAFAFTHDTCSTVEDLSDAAIGDDSLLTLVRFARGWIAAVEKVDDRATKLEDRLFCNR